MNKSLKTPLNPTFEWCKCVGLDQGPVVQAMSCRCGHREEGGGEGEGKRLHLGTGERERLVNNGGVPADQD